MKLEFADPLVERAVELAVAGREEEAAFHREREACYGAADPEDREAAFRELHRRWFVALDLERPFWEALAEVPAVGENAERVSVGLAARTDDEGAELYVASGRPDPGRPDPGRPDPGRPDPGRPDPGNGEPARAVVVRLLPARLADRPRLLWLLRRELLHVADMLDPAFGYAPRLPPSTAGPVHDELLRRRYAVLWSTSVVGRLARCGEAPEGVEKKARSRFEGTFSMLGQGAGELFARLWGGERPTHGELLRLAAEPPAAVATGGRCAVCGFPTSRRESGAELEAEVVVFLRRERPGWRPEKGVCPRCADLYRVRAGVFGVA